MIEMKVSQLNSYFDEQISSCHKRNESLIADERMDEANFAKVKANIYDIFRTILSVAVKNSKGDGDAVKFFFTSKIEQIPANWAASYDEAKQHNDAVKMQIESIKLETAREIREMFEKIWEE